MKKNAKLLDLLREMIDEDNLNEEKNLIYNITALNLMVHIDNTWNASTKESKITLSTSTKGGIELAINAESEAEYQKAVSSIQTTIGLLSKEFNKKLTAALAEYVVNK